MLSRSSYWVSRQPSRGPSPQHCVINEPIISSSSPCTVILSLRFYLQYIYVYFLYLAGSPLLLPTVSCSLQALNKLILSYSILLPSLPPSFLVFLPILFLSFLVPSHSDCIRNCRCTKGSDNLCPYSVDPK